MQYALWYGNCFNAENYPMKKVRLLLPLISIAFIFGLLNSCSKKRSDIARLLYAKTPNKYFKKLNADSVAAAIEAEMDNEHTPAAIKDFYDSHDEEPVLILHHFKGDELKAFADKLDSADTHGLDTSAFKAAAYRSLLHQFYDQKVITSTGQAYRALAKLELMTANLLVRYSNTLQYGAVNPSKIFQRYALTIKEPDGTAASHIFEVKHLTAYLDSIQPKDSQYLALQKALANHSALQGLSWEESRRVLMVNLERLRWKDKPTAARYLVVNIPDFHLDVMENSQSVLGMKVCVGKGRNMYGQETLLHYDDTDKVDRPVHETPLLSSVIYEAQVNPVWNIPASIASKEIITQAKADRFYLSNHNIDVFQKGQQVAADSVDWETANPANYSFQQEPGDDNALGKLKFLFKNKFSVYLHDTNDKAAFAHAMRAVSHGCVRVEQPLELAKALFGEGSKYDLIQHDFQLDSAKSTDIALPVKVPVYIIYQTCWADTSGALQYRKDVYGQDIILYANLLKKE